MLQVLYTSLLARSFGPDDLDHLLRSSRRNNPRTGICGVLTLRGQNAMQLIEGPPDAIRSLFDRLVADPRHTDLDILLQRTVPKAQFQQWSMAYLAGPMQAKDLLRPASLVDRLACAVRALPHPSATDQRNHAAPPHYEGLVPAAPQRVP